MRERPSPPPCHSAPPPWLGRGAAWAVLLAAGLTLGCESERPFTPFGTVGGATASASTPAPSTPSASAPPPPSAPPASPLAIRRSLLAPRGATSWNVEGQALTAPSGYVFERAVLTLAGDAVGYVVTPRDARRGGRPELWLHAAGRARRLLTLPAWMPEGGDCTFAGELTATGQTTLGWDVTAHCEVARAPSAAARALVLASTRPERPLLLALRFTALGEGDRLELDVDSSDRDADGRDDARIELRLTLAGEREPVVAPLVFLDRAAGVARDPSEPAATFATLATRWLQRAQRKSERAQVTAGVSQVRRALTRWCPELGAPRLHGADGTPLGCGALGKTLADLTAAELDAALGEGELLEASARLQRDGWFGALPKDRRARFEQRLTRATTQVSATATKLDGLKVRARAATEPPRYSPLSFEADGTLHVQTPDGVRVVAPDAREPSPLEPEAGVGPARWPLEATSAGGERWLGVVQGCDDELLRLSLAAPDGTARPLVPTSLLAARPGACQAGRGQPTGELRPLGWGPGGLEALVAASRIGPVTAGEIPRGSARSRDGKRLVAESPWGLLVLGGAAPERWTAEGIAPGELHECVVANGGERLACLRGQEVWRLE